MSLNGYWGNPKRDKWAELLVEITAIGLSLVIFGLQVAGWVTLGLVGWRCLNIGKDWV